MTKSQTAPIRDASRKETTARQWKKRMEQWLAIQDHELLNK